MPQFWAGYIDGKLDVDVLEDRFGGPGHERKAPAIFTSRAAASEQYQDVRKVEVRIVSKQK